MQPAEPERQHPFAVLFLTHNGACVEPRGSADDFPRGRTCLSPESGLGESGGSIIYTP